MKALLRRLLPHHGMHSADPRNVAVTGDWEAFAEHCLTHDPVV